MDHLGAVGGLLSFADAESAVAERHQEHEIELSSRTLKSRREMMGRKKAIISGITGQDGSFLAEFLLTKGYVVHGIVRRASTFNTARLQSVYSDQHESDARMFLHYGDVTDGSGLRSLVETVQPDEIYNLAAQSHVRVSFDQPEYTADTVGLGTLRML